MYRDSLGNVYWKTRAERLTALLEDEVKELAAIPSVVIVEKKAEAPPATPAPASSAIADDASRSAGKKAEEAAVRKEAEDIERVLDGIGCGKRQAREMVARTLAQLATLGRPPTGEEILNTALHGRVMIQKAPSSAIADDRKSRGSLEDPRGGQRPPAGGDAGAGPEGGSRIAS